MVQSVLFRNLPENLSLLFGKDKVSINGKAVDIKEVPLVRVSISCDTDVDALTKCIEEIRKVFRFSAVTLEGEHNALNDSVIDRFYNVTAIFMHIDFSELNSNNDLISRLSSEKKIYKWIIEDEKQSMMVNDVRNIREIFGKTLKQRVGFCKTPFSNGCDGCISAVDAREILSLYCDSDEVAIPAAGHEVGNTNKEENFCTCFRFTVVNSIGACEEKVKAVREKNEEDNKEKKTTKNNTKAIQFGRFSL